MRTFFTSFLFFFGFFYFLFSRGYTNGLLNCSVCLFVCYLHFLLSILVNRWFLHRRPNASVKMILNIVGFVLVVNLVVWFRCSDGFSIKLPHFGFNANSIMMNVFCWFFVSVHSKVQLFLSITCWVLRLDR